jgi:hypothetical protein
MNMVFAGWSIPHKCLKECPTKLSMTCDMMMLCAHPSITESEHKCPQELKMTLYSEPTKPPPRANVSSCAADNGSLRNGGLQQLFAMVLAGLAAQTPRMVSASIMALSRLTFEFAPQLQVIASQLLPSICALLRSKAREVIKAVLGFLKVAAMRVPIELLTPHLRDVVSGVLLWAEDTKNRYKLKVRHLVERLCKRCGYDTVAAVWPASELKLLTAIRKEFARKARRKTWKTGEDGDDDASEGHSRMARTARASAWGHSAMFSDEEDDRGRARSAAPSKKSGVTALTGAVCSYMVGLIYKLWHSAERFGHGCSCG